MSTRTPTPQSIAWPLSRLGELLENLARRSGYTSRPLNVPQPPAALHHSGNGNNAASVGEWLDSAAGYLGLEAEPVSVTYNEVERLLLTGGPAILRLPDDDTPSVEAPGGDTPRYLALLPGRAGRVALLQPDLRLRHYPLETVRRMLCAPYESSLDAPINGLLQDAGVAPERMGRARAAILRDQLGALRLEVGWMLRLPPSAHLHSQFRHGGVYRPVWVLLAMYVVQQAISLGSWLVIGRAIFSGHFDMGWMMAWAVLLLSGIPVQIIVSDAQAELSMAAGALFKQRLIQGTLKLDPEEIRHQGMGQFLNRVMESEAVELLALSGGFTALLSFIELGLAMLVLSQGAAGWISSASLAVWTLLTLGLLWRYHHASQAWSDAYREMTNHIVEEMVGHRTRLVQEDLRRRHSDEDQELERYMKLSETLDSSGMQINAAVSRGWILLGLGGVALAFVGGEPNPTILAIGLGGVLLGAQALSKLASGAQSLSNLLNAWRQVGPLFSAAARARSLPALGFVPPERGQSAAPFAGQHDLADAQAVLSGGNGRTPLIQTRDLQFRYRPQGRPVLSGIDLSIYPGDRLLLEGPSGGGKTTLGALLTGLRLPESGSMLLWGYDRQLLGQEAWRKRVVMAPQFQENHVFSETLAFNLLMGRRWPPEAEDLAEAEAVCQELGLGEVIARMPSGFQQMLGESGWQLSHGERSRLYIARTLLQQADLIVLDESFGALDPENLQRAMQCVLRRAPTVLVIAHP